MKLVAKLVKKYQIRAQATDLTESFAQLKESISQELNRMAPHVEDSQALLEKIEDLATLVYKEGDDYYGSDYIKQYLPHEQKLFIREFNSTEADQLWDFASKFKQLSHKLQDIYMSLLDEAKYVEDPEAMAVIKERYPEVLTKKISWLKVLRLPNHM